MELPLERAQNFEKDRLFSGRRSHKADRLACARRQSEYYKSFMFFKVHISLNWIKIVKNMMTMLIAFDGHLS